MSNLDRIKTIVVVMMENRSFDHMLGYLSLPPFNQTDIGGQSADPVWLGRITNNDQGQAVQPFPNNDPYTLPPGFDPPHQRPDVAKHLGTRQNSDYPMNGFVGAIPNTVSGDPKTRRLVMGYFGDKEAPINFPNRHGQYAAKSTATGDFYRADLWRCSAPWPIH